MTTGGWTPRAADVCCGASELWAVDNTLIAPGAGTSPPLIDLYRAIQVPSPAFVAAAPGQGLGPVIWGSVVRRDGTRLTRTILELRGTHDSAFAATHFHSQILQRGSFFNASTPALIGRVAMFGPILVPFRFLDLTITNTNTAAQTYDIRLYGSPLGHSAIGHARSYAQQLGDHAAFHIHRRVVVGAGATVRSPNILIDPGHNLAAELVALSALGAGVEIAQVDGNRAHFVVDITGTAALSGLTFRTRYGEDIGAQPLPFIAQTDTLIAAGPTRLDSDELTILIPAAGARFQPHLKGTWVQFEWENTTAVATTVTEVWIRVDRE